MPRPLHCQRTCNRDGFTLVELLIVLAILVVVSAATVPALGRWQRELPMREATSLVKERLLQARLLAIDRGISVAFLFQPNEPRFCLQWGNPPVTDAVELPNGIRFASVEQRSAAWSNPIWFHPNGTATDAELSLLDDSGSMQRVVVRRLTGTVKSTRE